MSTILRMRLLTVLAVAVAVGAICFLLIGDLLGTGAALVLTAPAVAFTAFALGVGLR